MTANQAEKAARFRALHEGPRAFGAHPRGAWIRGAGDFQRRNGGDIRTRARAARAARRDANAASPTIFREDGYRFFFFSREEARLHVHVHCADGEAKFWLEPQIELAQNYRLSDRQIRAVEAMIRKHDNDIRAAWRKHFGR